jgi:alanine racemase
VEHPVRPRARAVINTTAISDSTRHLRSCAPTAELMAVVKADGYGHGLVPSARAALAGGATWLGTAFVDEGLALRAAGITAPVLSWLAVPGEDLGPAVAAGLDLAASAPWGVGDIVAGVGARAARVHLKVDTGLTRAGARPDADWEQLCRAAAAAQADGSIEVVGVWSHLVHGDDPHHPTNEHQLGVFTEALALAARLGIVPQIRHLASSGATLARPDLHLDLVRPGIAVYGISPWSGTVQGLHPAMSLRADVALVKDLPVGTGISYGHTHVTATGTRSALVPMGYADGIPRRAGDLCEVAVAGQRLPIVGRVCMDQVVIDCGVAQVSAGDEVIVFGRGGPSVDEWAARLGTISYELLTGVGARVVRIYEEST